MRSTPSFWSAYRRVVADPRLDAIAAFERFVACINDGDATGLGALMTDDHELLVFDVEPVRGRDANIEAWVGYATSWPDYRIYAHETVEQDGKVAMLGHTTGSHLELPDDIEARETLIWVADITDGRLRTWQLVEDTAEHRRELGFDRDP
jgi:ketosteroid isomerase-like protein